MNIRPNMDAVGPIVTRLDAGTNPTYEKLWAERLEATTMNLLGS